MGGSPIDPSSRASSELSLNPASASDQDNNGSNGVNCNDVANNGSRSPRFSVDVSLIRLKIAVRNGTTGASVKGNLF